MVNNDSVVRTSYYKYFHPKVRPRLTSGPQFCLQECLVQNGVLNRAVSEAAGKVSDGKNKVMRENQMFSAH